jgi:hypothetical protein
MDAGLQVTCERSVDGGDAVGRCADGLLHRNPGALLAGAGRTDPPSQASGAGEFVQECVAFRADGVKPADV